MLTSEEKEEQKRLSIMSRLALVEDDVDDLFNLLKEALGAMARLTEEAVKDRRKGIT